MAVSDGTGEDRLVGIQTATEAAPFGWRHLIEV